MAGILWLPRWTFELQSLAFVVYSFARKNSVTAFLDNWTWKAIVALEISQHPSPTNFNHRHPQVLMGQGSA